MPLANHHLAIGRNAPLDHLGDKLVLVPLADSGAGLSLDFESVRGWDEHQAVNAGTRAYPLERIDALAGLVVKQCDIGAQAQDSVENRPEPVRGPQVAVADIGDSRGIL